MEAGVGLCMYGRVGMGRMDLCCMRMPVCWMIVGEGGVMVFTFRANAEQILDHGGQPRPRHAGETAEGGGG